MNTILVPTDFSAFANNAVEYAVEIARAWNSHLIILHVLPYEIHPGSRTFIEADSKLKATCQAITDEFPALTCTAELVHGDRVLSILEAAREKRPDLIVMGTKGTTVLENLFFGSNTAAVIEKSECPVLSVPHATPFTSLSKLLFATNFQHEDIKGAVQLVMLAKRFQASVIITHVTTVDERQEVDESMLKMFSRELASLTDYPNISYKILNDNTVSMGLDSMIAETGANLIAFSTRKRGLLEKLYNPSLTKKFSSHASIPLLAFHNN